MFVKNTIMLAKSIAVCGAGTMGSGIAQMAAQSGLHTILFDINETVLLNGKKAIEKNLQLQLAKNKLTEATYELTLQHLSYTNDINNCKANVIIEAIVENIEVKQQLFTQLQAVNSPATIYASNTSSISIEKLSSSFNSPSLFCGMHFFNPATVMKLVEIITHTYTSNETIKIVEQLGKQMGKTTVVCKDSPGFIVNRVARHYYLQAMLLIENGTVTDIATIDAVLENAGFKMGPFKLMDLIGLDVNFAVSNIVWNDMGKPKRLTPSTLQQQMVSNAHLGKKTNKGFYNY